MTNRIDRLIFDTLTDSVGEDFIGELVDTFLEEAPVMLEEMQQALTAGDVDGFRRAAHSLKTNANTFGAMGLAEQAKELEMMARENNLEVGSRLSRLKEAYETSARELIVLKANA